ncbi:hypothetical protein [Streptosporangium saharense]|uniref:Uncharacterized protein n=1 Tax=Streptosporangium saharense TaxID=1706840 RepID=A0A7W7QPT9_9ACTN|nr:hypothetical protein [Streptosporangium saharense]MBB4917556.1 hypothetical protein [Streptosporangium saharense]
MSDSGLSFTEITVLMVLAVEGEEIANPDLEKRYGVALKKASRERLNDLKLIESSKQGRSFVHILTDRGWEELKLAVVSDISAPRGAGGAMSLALLSLVRGILTRTGRGFLELFLPEDAPEAPVEVEVEGDVTTRIRAAYAKLADKPGDWINLVRLRPLLGDATREEVDIALKGMIHIPEVSIVPESNRKTLTPEARAAAVIIGEQEKHLIAIEAL